MKLRDRDVFFRHRHPKPSFTDASTDQDIWQPHALHTMLEQNSSTFLGTECRSFVTEESDE
jgi:hypothetical protein